MLTSSIIFCLKFTVRLNSSPAIHCPFFCLFSVFFSKMSEVQSFSKIVSLKPQQCNELSTQDLRFSHNSPTCTPCLLESGWLQSTAAVAIASHPIILASPKCWGLYCNRAAPLPKASPGISSGTLILWHDAKPQIISMTPSVLRLLLQLRLHLH